MIKKALKVIVFILIFVVIFCIAANALSFKYIDATYKIDCFYELEDNTVDVLALGSSHIYRSFNTALLWEEYGYSAFALSSSEQPIWNTYYYLEEALKTQTPKVIVLDVYMLYLSEEFVKTETAIKQTYGFKWSQTKIDAMKASFNTEESGYQYFVSWLQYHSKYTDLKRRDFCDHLGNEAMYGSHKGFVCNFATKEIEEHGDYTDYSECSVLPEKGEKYYRKIIELAQSKNIPIIITSVPYKASQFNIKYVNTAHKIADEYGVPFYDFLRDYKADIAMDYKTDFADNGHVNHLGSTKVTRFFGDLFKKEYDVKDHRGDKKYVSWEEDAKVYYAQLENKDLPSCETVDDYLEIFDRERYTIIMTMSTENYDLLSDEAKADAKKLFDKVNVSENDYKEGGLWVFQGNRQELYKEFDDKKDIKSIRLEGHDTAFVEMKESSEKGGYFYKDVYINKNNYTKTENGINIVVYDTIMQSIIDSVGVDFGSKEFVR